ncbi:MAG: T9SS type A sorting domain-containing protein [Candidatus Eisenbacteria bacterium]|uniref:T9SS type A sorting domain-containing protein n=1 Tax=Eiseniibacteriota bacterium TaxID=2212470 RepID=A0A948RZS4_UNCEI|nr:T9SS type A sorting domain-containing protein [Candidatus Eisenbacteria bacterium]MBU1950911.1 T9SS type A sorting domain-containing protein [Candidatus Eisenbacteria bacterium]MBU2692594.1 T9SS type A sorting domain-containing protein [Candidatus Eisenbacteria bacterium]
MRHSFVSKLLLSASAVVILTGTPVVAQHTLDGCIFYDNLPVNGEVGGCATFDAATLISTFLYNDEAVINPLTGAAYNDPYNTPGILPDFMPPAGSIALGAFDDIASPILWQRECEIECAGTPPWMQIEPVCFRGAMAPVSLDPIHGGDWTEGWTYYNYDGADRTDLSAAPPDTLRGSYYTPVTIGPDKAWWLDGKVLIEPGSSITILPGTVIRGVPFSVGTLVIKRGAQIFAEGTAEEPIIITSGFEPGLMENGDIGGLVVTGRAISNCADCWAGDSCLVEGFIPQLEDVFYCGDNDCDNSGVIKYLRVEYSGEEIEPNNELNCIVFAGVGYGTEVDYIEAFRGSDDLVEWFGGCVYVKHIFAAGGWDDGIDWQMGWRGGVQFAIVQQWADESSERGIEADNNEDGYDRPCRSNPILANLTLVRSTHDGNAGSGIKLRRGTDAQIYNSIVMGWSSKGLDIDNDATCARGFNPQGPAINCQDASNVDEIVASSQLKVDTFPSPITNNASFAFSLQKASHTALSIFDPAGRQIASLINESLNAGQHSVTWNLPRHAAAGTYFYSLTSGGETKTGRLIAVR